MAGKELRLTSEDVKNLNFLGGQAPQTPLVTHAWVAVSPPNIMTPAYSKFWTYDSLEI